MRFRNFILILAMSFMFAQWAVAGFPPVRIGGILQSLVTKFTLLFPAKSVVNRGGVTAYIDTDVSNLLHDGSFEGIALSTDWTFSGGTTSFETADKVDGNQALRITASASTPVLRQTVSTKSGLPLVVGCMVKTDQNFVEVCAKDNTTDVLCTDVPSDNTWRFLKFPIVAGNDGGIEVRSSQNITGNIDVDKCRVEYSDTTQDIAQSELAFDVNIGTASNYVWSSAQTSYVGLTPSDADMVINKASGTTQIPCSGTNPSTGLTCAVGNESLGVVFDAKVGEYEICADFSFYTTLGSFFTFQLIETANSSQTILQEGKGRAETGFDTGGTGGSIRPHVCGTFYFSTSGKKTIRLMHEKSGGGTGIFLLDRSTAAGQRDMHITGKYYPPKTKIVTQLQEETVQTANEFSAKISNTGVVSDENLDWINGNCSILATSQFTCNFNPNIFTVAPNCVVSVAGSNRTGNLLETTTASVFTVETGIADTSGFSAIAQPFEVHCQKQGADYNKSRMVYGQFEQIKTTELAYVKAAGNTGGVVSPSQNVNFTETHDNTNSFNGTVFTAPRDGNYIFDGSFFITASAATDWFIYINNTAIKRVSTDITAYTAHKFFTIEKLNAGDTVSFRPSGSVTLSNNSAYHYLFITELPDIAAIVKNLNDNKNVKCQTKVLSANVLGTDGVLSDLTFNNLVVGKKYKSILWGRFQFAVVDNSMTLFVLNNGKYVNFIEGSSAAVVYFKGYGNTSIFTAESTTATTTLASTAGALSGVVYQFGTDFRATGHTLCELPDNYIETTEF